MDNHRCDPDQMTLPDKVSELARGLATDLATDLDSGLAQAWALTFHMGQPSIRGKQRPDHRTICH